MKIEPRDYNFIRAAMRASAKKYPNSYDQYMRQGLSEMRYRWDLFWSTGIKIGDGKGVRGDINLHAYLNDDHIDTALRKIVKELIDMCVLKVG